MKIFSKVALRGLRQRERVQKMAEMTRPGIRVVPAKDEYRKVLSHPKVGGFAAEGAKEWPNDRFTKRRLADGSVTREEKEQDGQPEERRGKGPPPRQDDDQDNDAA